MTIIAYKDGVMAADSCSFRDGRRFPTSPKIVRGSDGSLAGAGGTRGNTQAFKAWFLDGADGAPPRMEGGAEADFSAIIVRPDRSIWATYGDGRLIHVHLRVETAGEPMACTFCEAAMLAGLDAEQAVRLTIEHCIYVGGDVQVERL